MRNVYVRRWTDDIREDQDEIRGENDAYLEDMTGNSEALGVKFLWFVSVCKREVAGAFESQP
jgi:hypothetical protein